MAYKFQTGAARLSGSVISVNTGSAGLSGSGGAAFAGVISGSSFFVHNSKGLWDGDGIVLLEGGAQKLLLETDGAISGASTLQVAGAVNLGTTLGVQGTSTFNGDVNIASGKTLGVYKISGSSALTWTLPSTASQAVLWFAGSGKDYMKIDTAGRHVVIGSNYATTNIGGKLIASGASAMQALTATTLSASSNISTAGDLKLGGTSGYGMTKAGVASIASMGANWTNASRTVADMGVVTTVDLNGGSIDGTIIGGNSAVAGTFAAIVGTTVNASSTVTAGAVTSSGEIAGNTAKFGGLNFEGNTATGGVLTSNTGVILFGSSADQELRSGVISGSSNLKLAGDLKLGGASGYGMTKAGVASIASMGANWTNASRTVADMGTVTTIDLNGGNIDGTVIGASTAAAGTFAAVVGTTVSASSHLYVAGKGIFGRSVVIQGGLTVQGTSTVISSSQLLVKDALIGMGFSGSGDAISVGDRALIMGQQGENSVAMIWDESESEFAFVRTTTNPASGSGAVNIVSYANLRVGSIQGGQTLAVTAVASGTDLSTGFNYQTGSAAAAVTAKLPASPEAGDVVYVKANSGTDAGKPVTVSIQGSHLIDGLGSVVLQSPDAAANFIYVTTNVWKVF